MKLSQRLIRRYKWEKYLWMDRLYSIFHPSPKILDTEATIEYIIKHRCSVSRFGDGEIGLITGENLNFQKYEETLAEKMSAILATGQNGLLVCVPKVFTKGDREKLSRTDANFWRSNLIGKRRIWYKLMNKSIIYGDALMSRIYSPTWNKENASKLFYMLEQIWKERDILIVEGEYSRLGVGNTCFSAARTIRRIIAPAKDAFSKYRELTESICNTADKDTLVILALGPTATALAADLSANGFQAIDLGHLDVEYEWLCTGATKKIPVRGKFVNEAFLTKNSVQEVVGILNDNEMAEYQSQIIARFI